VRNTARMAVYGDEGSLFCINITGHVYFIAGKNGRMYALNQAAMRDEISRRTQGGTVFVGDVKKAQTPDINEILKTSKIPEALIHAGEALCDRTAAERTGAAPAANATDWHPRKHGRAAASSRQKPSRFRAESGAFPGKLAMRPSLVPAFFRSTYTTTRTIS